MRTQRKTLSRFSEEGARTLRTYLLVKRYFFFRSSRTDGLP